MRRRLVVWGSIAVLICVGVGGVAPPGAGAGVGGYVSSAGGQFTLDGGAWMPLGYNQYRLTSTLGGFVCDGSYGPISDASLAQRLDQMKRAGANTVRSWFFHRYWQHGPPGDQWAAFDRLLSFASARGLKAVPVLVNHWADCEWPTIDNNHGFYASAYL